MCHGLDLQERQLWLLRLKREFQHQIGHSVEIKTSIYLGTKSSLQYVSIIVLLVSRYNLSPSLEVQNSRSLHSRSSHQNVCNSCLKKNLSRTQFLDTIYVCTYSILNMTLCAKTSSPQVDFCYRTKQKSLTIALWYDALMACIVTVHNVSLDLRQKLYILFQYSCT